MEPITSPQNPRFKRALRLHQSRGRQQQNRIIVFGRREVIRAIEAGVAFEEIMFDAGLNSTGIQTINNTLKNASTIAGAACTFAVAESLFAKLSYGVRNVEVIGIAERPSTTLANLQPDNESLVIVLESIEKPGNLGAIARSADSSGTDGLLIVDPLTDIFHPNAIRSSVATVFSVPIATATSDEAQNWLLENKYSILIATPDATRTIYDTDLNGRIAVVFGNEAKGLSAQWRKGQYAGVKLPMFGRADSLNVSVTASLMMYERRRRLHAE